MKTGNKQVAPDCFVNFQLNGYASPGGDLTMKTRYLSKDNVVISKGNHTTSQKFQKFQNLNEAIRLSQLKAAHTNTSVTQENFKKTNSSLYKTNPN